MNEHTPTDCAGPGPTPGGTIDAAAINEDLAPGSPAALMRGCRCSVLANAFYRVGAEQGPLVDPACGLHQRPGPDPVPPSTARAEPDPARAEGGWRHGAGTGPPDGGDTTTPAP
jgi:hypothetical protein